MEWCIQHGWPITIVETEAHRVAEGVQGGHREVLAAGEALAPTGSRVHNYVAGQPFPNLDPKDPQVAIKIMWNCELHSYLTTDDVDLRNFDADTGADRGQRPADRRAPLPPRPLPPPVLERAPLRRAEAGEAEPERHPRPAGPLPVLEPFDLKGVGALGNRYIDPGEAGRLVALPAVAPPRAPALHRAALRRALRPGHRRRQLLRLRRPHRLDGLEVPRRARGPRRRSTPRATR